MSDKIKDGGPAFPLSDNNLINICLNNNSEPMGMSLRDYFAAKAMEKFIDTFEVNGHYIKEYGVEYISENAYKFADAMLEARGK